ncbi:MAG TPA: hypothetical protein VFN40_02725 [Gemmatimonadales bacterium]|nr:hypothetical protein [Gemmatimonadales bacterium]
MLTAAEEEGLAGLALASRVQHALYRLAPADLADLIEDLRVGALDHHVVYLHEGEVEPIRILPAPLTVLPEQIAYVHRVTLAVQEALERLPSLYLHDFTVREILRLPDAEEAWLRDCWGPSQEAHNPVFGRLDALVDFTSPMWKETLRFVEPNMSGIGGLHMVPTCERLLADIVVPVLRDGDAGLDLTVGQDMRELLVRMLLKHAAAIGAGPNICFVEPKYAGNGPDEQGELARWLRDRYGLTVMHADPSELVLEDGRVWYEGQPVDLAYRDYGVVDLLELAAEGVDVEPMRVLLRENRVVSSIASDLDQKACWEVLTDPRLCQQYFTPEDRQLFQRHILWTRVLGDRRTVLPDGRQGNLLEYARSSHEALVLKPNRMYGGEGIVIGPAVTREEWDVALQAALADPDDRWVVQQLASIPVREFPVVGPDGAVHIEPFYTVMGFAASQDGVAILARASQKQVVNVAQHGGICGVLVSHSRPPVGVGTDAGS